MVLKLLSIVAMIGGGGMLIVTVSILLVFYSSWLYRRLEDWLEKRK